MIRYKIKTTLGTEVIVPAEHIVKAIYQYCADWDRGTDTIKSIERME